MQRVKTLQLHFRACKAGLDAVHNFKFTIFNMENLASSQPDVYDASRGQ